MPFDLRPILKGELLELRPLRADDFDELFAVASDPLIWEQHPSNDRYKLEVFKEFFRQAMESGGALVAIDLRDGRVIGSSRFNGYDEMRSEIEIGWTFLAQVALGRCLQRGNETAHAPARLPVREARDLSYWSTESALATGHGTNRRGTRWIEGRREWAREFRLRDPGGGTAALRGKPMTWHSFLLSRHFDRRYTESMSQTAALDTESEILEQVIEPGFAGMSPETAQRCCDFGSIPSPLPA